MVQSVPEFMEQGEHLVMGQQRGFTRYRWGEVTGQVGDRQLYVAVVQSADNALVHPGAAALVRAGIQVEIKSAAQPAAIVTDLEIPYIGVPGFNPFPVCNTEAV